MTAKGLACNIERNLIIRKEKVMTGYVWMFFVGNSHFIKSINGLRDPPDEEEEEMKLARTSGSRGSRNKS